MGKFRQLEELFLEVPLIKIMYRIIHTRFDLDSKHPLLLLSLPFALIKILEKIKILRYTL